MELADFKCIEGIMIKYLFQYLIYYLESLQFEIGLETVNTLIPIEYIKWSYEVLSVISMVSVNMNRSMYKIRVLFVKNHCQNSLRFWQCLADTLDVKVRV